MTMTASRIRWKAPAVEDTGDFETGTLLLIALIAAGRRSVLGSHA